MFVQISFLSQLRASRIRHNNPRKASLSTLDFRRANHGRQLLPPTHSVNEFAFFATSARETVDGPKTRSRSWSPSDRGRHARTRQPSPSRAGSTRFVGARNQEKNDVLRAELQEQTTALLETPMGAWTPSQWRESVQLIHRWTERNPDNMFRRRWVGMKTSVETQDEDNPVFVSGTAESVLSAFSLLERLLVEYRRNQSKTLAHELIRSDLLDGCVLNWAFCWEQIHSSEESQVTSDDAEQMAKILLSYNAESILARMDTYHVRSQGLLKPSTLTYHRLVTAAAASGTKNLCIKVLDRLARNFDGNDSNKKTNESNDFNQPQSLLPEQTSSKDFSVEKSTDLSRSTYLKFIRTCARMDDAAQAEACLEHMYEQSVRTGLESLQPTTKDFNAVLLAWSAHSIDLRYASERSQGILRRMGELSQPGGALEGKVKPDYFSYSLVMKSLSKWLSAVLTATLDNVAEYQHVGEIAEKLLKEMEDRYRDDERKLRPNIGAYNSALRVLSQLGNAERAEAVLQRMYEDFTLNNNLLAKPETASFNFVLTAWRNRQKTMRASTNVFNSKGHLPSVAIGERSEAILKRMQELHQSGSLLGVKPNSASYLAVLHCWADTRGDEAGERALAILEEAKAMERSSGEKILNPIFYRGVIQAFATAGDALNAERVMAEFHRQYYEDGNLDAKPTMHNLSILLNAWAKSNNPKAPERAETILKEANKLYNEGVLDAPPNSVSYTSVVECYAKSSLPDATDRAKAILDDMDRRSREGENHLRPSDVSYRNVMAAYASRGMVKETEDYLDKMLKEWKKVTAKAMNLVLTAYSNSEDPNAGAKAVAYLKRMEKLYDKQLLDGKPDVISYTLALKCISNSINEDAGEEAEKLLKEMETRASQGESSLSPNTLTYSTIIQIYGRSGRPEKAESILERMYKQHQEGNMDVTPNTRTFTSVLQAWARSGLKGSSDRAVAILERMKELHQQGVLHDVKPNCITYATVLGALATSRQNADCQRALDLLEEMEELAITDPEVAPNDVAWNNALRTFANVGDGIKAQETLAKMYHKFETGRLSSKPNIISWQSVVEAWARSKDPNAAFRVSAIWKRILELYDDGVLEEKPNAQLYILMLECFSKCSHKDTRTRIGEILEDVERMASSSSFSLTMFDNLRIIRALTRLKGDDANWLVQAENVLHRMLRDYDRASPQWNPNAIRASYIALIAAWRKSRDRQGLAHAYRLQKELETLRLSFVSRESTATQSP